ncbi:MAG: hypothetical protein ACI85I_002178 [Arenicella sp.]|jgi:hypothetical protein
MTQKYFLKLFILLLLCICFSISESSAFTGDDPLGKPKVWEQLKKSPIDSVLWAQYLGKAWICMNVQETKKIGTWSKDLLHILELEHDSGENVIWNNPKDHIDGKLEYVDHAIEEEKDRLEAEMKVYEKDLEASVLKETTQMQRLKQNLLINFVVIEDLYQEEFEKLGVKYVWYEDKYPKRNHNKSQWIQEKEEELKQVKKVEFLKKKDSLVEGSF